MTRRGMDVTAAARSLAACQRILVLGSGGAGKSTAARALAAALDLPLHHLDRLFWRPGWQPTPDAEWAALQVELVRGERWVIDGDYSGTLPIRLGRADGVLLLDLPRTVCIWRVLWRAARHWGRQRADVGEGCPEHVDLAFLRWIWAFPRRSRGTLLKAMASRPPGQVWVVVGTPGDARRLLAAVAAEGQRRQGAV